MGAWINGLMMISVLLSLGWMLLRVRQLRAELVAAHVELRRHRAERDGALAELAVHRRPPRTAFIREHARACFLTFLENGSVLPGNTEIASSAREREDRIAAARAVAAAGHLYDALAQAERGATPTRTEAA